MPVQFFALSPGITVALTIWAIGSGLIIIDLYRMYRKRQRGETFSWFGSPLLWFAACAFPIGLMIVVISTFSFLYQFFGYWLTASFLLFLFFLVGGLIAVVRWDAQQVALQQETRLRQQAESNPWSVAASKPVMHLTTVGMMIAILIIIFFTPPRIFAIYTHHYPPVIWLILPIIALMMMMMAATIPFSSAQKRFNERLSTRKSSLAAENRWLGAREHTAQEPLQTVMPPLVLRLKRIILFCYPVLIAACTYLILSTATTPSATNTVFQILIYPPILLLYLLSDWGERVEVTTQDLAVAHGVWFARQQQRLPWQEARLFICYQPFSLFKRKTTMTYELLGSSRSVRWTRIISTRSLFMPWKPELPGEEYARRTQELCSFITRQTGLQLHDLSEERPNASKQEMLVESRLQR